MCVTANFHCNLYHAFSEVKEKKKKLQSKYNSIAKVNIYQMFAMVCILFIGGT